MLFFPHSNAAHGNGTHPLSRNATPEEIINKNVRPKRYVIFVGHPHKEPAPEYKLVRGVGTMMWDR